MTLGAFEGFWCQNKDLTIIFALFLRELRSWFLSLLNNKAQQQSNCVETDSVKVGENSSTSVNKCKQDEKKIVKQMKDFTNLTF